MKVKPLTMLAMLAAVASVSAIVVIWLPGFILDLLQHPDGSYLSALLQKHQLKNPVVHTAEFYSTFVPAVALRLLLMTCVLAVVVFLLCTHWRTQLSAYWNFQATAFNLGVLRAVIASQALLTELDPIYALPDLSQQGLNIPVGWGWFLPLLPPSHTQVSILMGLYKGLGMASVLGLFTRFTLPAFMVVAFFAQLLPHFVGKIVHHHHLFLSLVILTLSPCGEAFSLDYWLRRWRRQTVPDVHAERGDYGRAFVWVWSMMGALYFFTGFWKVVIGGMAWALSDNIPLKIAAKIFETGQDPIIPLYQYPLLCQIGGLGTLAFELGFPLAMIFPTTRVLFAFGGLGFHVINGLVMQIPSTTLPKYYLSFINWSRWLGTKSQVKDKEKVHSVSASQPKWKTVVSGITVGGLVMTGLMNIDSWPWAIYPTFAALEQKTVSSIAVQARELNGNSRIVLLQEDGGLIASYNNRTRLRAYLNQVLQERDPQRRQLMLQTLLTPWFSAHSFPAGTEFEIWHVLVPLLPLHSPPELFRSLGVYP